MAGRAEVLPEELRGHTQPPRGFQLDPSRCKSALVQEDGGRADSVAAWMKLRQQWTQLMGPWPELLEHAPLRIWRPPAKSISISSSESNCRLL